MVIGLTGGLASGKSLVSGEFSKLGAHVIDADIVAREVIQKGAPAYRELVREFGEGVLTRDGSIDRKKLSGIVFSDNAKLKRLNAITHPAILGRIREEVSLMKEKRRVIVVDAALLIETGLYREMDKVIVVFADEKTQIERFVRKAGVGGAGGEEARARLRAQMPLSEKLPLADYVIDNSATMEAAREEAGRIYRELTGGAANG